MFAKVSESLYPLDLRIFHVCRDMSQCAAFFASFENATRAHSHLKSWVQTLAQVIIFLFRFGEIGARVWLSVLFTYAFAEWFIVVIIVEILAYIFLCSYFGEKKPRSISRCLSGKPILHSSSTFRKAAAVKCVSPTL